MTIKFCDKRTLEQCKYADATLKRTDISPERKQELLKSSDSQYWYFANLRMELYWKENPMTLKHKLVKFWGGNYHDKKNDSCFNYVSFFKRKWYSKKYKIKKWITFKCLDIEILWCEIRIKLKI